MAPCGRVTSQASQSCVAQADAHAAAQPFHRRRGEGALRIIVLDDDADTVETLSTVLRHAGHDVYGVSNGKEVLPTARFVRPDAIILDLSVPGMSGYAVAQTLRQSFTEARRPLLIAITGKWKEASDRQVAQQVGFDHYLLKPCDPQDVLELLERLHRPDPGPGLEPR
jgi:CheY-like chemotaxis protein